MPPDLPISLHLQPFTSRNCNSLLTILPTSAFGPYLLTAATENLMSPVGWWPVLWNPEESYYGLQSHRWLYLFNLISSCSPIFITQQGSQNLSGPSKNQPPSTAQPLPGLFSLSGHLSSPHLSCFAVLSDFYLSVTFLGKLFLTPQAKLAPYFLSSQYIVLFLHSISQVQWITICPWNS